jgi:hypothetical protein
VPFPEFGRQEKLIEAKNMAKIPPVAGRWAALETGKWKLETRSWKMETGN